MRVQIEPFSARLVVLSGVLWGIGHALATSLVQPIEGMSLLDWLRFTTTVGLPWIPAGIVWAAGVRAIEERQRGVRTFAALLILTWLIGAAGSLLIDPPLSLLSTDTGDIVVYQFWCNMFYGGLYAAGYLATRRRLRIRSALMAGQRARDEADSALREAHLSSLLGQLQPATLIEALATLRTRYSASTMDGNRLFDVLIAFLRSAMPGMRRGRSTLRAELAVLANYVALRRALGGGTTLQTPDLAAAPVDLSFPPLVLLPSLDAVSRALPAEATLAIGSALDGGCYHILLVADVADMPPLERIAAQLSDRLAAVGAALVAGPAGSSFAFDIRIPLHAPA